MKESEHNVPEMGPSGGDPAACRLPTYWGWVAALELLLVVRPSSACAACWGMRGSMRRVDPERQSGHHIVTDLNALVAGCGGADAPGEGGSLAQGRGSLFGPRG